MNIIKAEEKDLKECLNVIQDSFATEIKELNITEKTHKGNSAFINYDEIQRMFINGVDIYFYKEEVTNKLFACVALEKKSEVKYKVKMLSVLKEYRHLGYAKQLMMDIENICRINGINKIVLGMIYKNKKLISFYKSLNYNIEKVKKYKNEEILFLKKDLHEKI